MPRIFTPAVLGLLLPLLVLPACATTQHPNYTATTLCFAGFGLEIAAAVTDKPVLLVPAILSWFGCSAATAYTPYTPMEYPEAGAPEAAPPEGGHER